MRKMGVEKMGNLSQIVSFSPIFSYFLSISHIVYTLPKMYFWQKLTIPHSSPFPPIIRPPPPFFSIFSHLSHFPHFSMALSYLVTLVAASAEA